MTGSMKQYDENNYFGELPQALVEQLVARGESLGSAVTDSLEKIKSLREGVRKQLEEDGLLSRIDDLRMV